MQRRYCSTKCLTSFRAGQLGVGDRRICNGSVVKHERETLSAFGLFEAHSIPVAWWSTIAVQSNTAAYAAICNFN